MQGSSAQASVPATELLLNALYLLLRHSHVAQGSRSQRWSIQPGGVRAGEPQPFCTVLYCSSWRYLCTAQGPLRQDLLCRMEIEGLGSFRSVSCCSVFLGLCLESTVTAQILMPPLTFRVLPSSHQVLTVDGGLVASHLQVSRITT